MPLYIYRCRECLHEQEEIRPIAKIYQAKFCELCGSAMQNIIAKPAKFIRGQGAWSSPESKGV
jgi:putative FmdB family regulatory protein